VSSFQTFVLVVGTGLLVVAAGVIVWRELGREADGRFLDGWRDVAGLAATLSGLVVLLVSLWATR